MNIAKQTPTSTTTTTTAVVVKSISNIVFTTIMTNF
jgi:hypothetical protein